MPLFRHTIRRSSRREQVRRIDRFFERAGQVLLIAYALFVFVAWLSYRPAVRITEIQIEGTQAVDAKSVQDVVESQLARRLLWKIDRNNAPLYPRSAIRSRVMALDTHVKDVDTSIEGGRIVVHVTEYVPALLWCPPDLATATTTLTVGCFFADNAGHIFAPAPWYSGSPFLIFATMVPDESGRTILPREEFDKVNTFLRKLTDLGIAPRIVLENGANDFTIMTGEPWTVRWSPARDPEEDARNLSIVLQNLSGDHVSTSTLKSVDLRFGNKVFYR